MQLFYTWATVSAGTPAEQQFSREPVETQMNNVL